MSKRARTLTLTVGIGLVAVALLVSGGVATGQPSGQAGSGLQASMTATISGTVVTYSITLANTGGSDTGDIYIAGTVPSGTTFLAATATPAGSTFQGFQAAGTPLQAAVWLSGKVAAGASQGPFTYQVSKGTAIDLSAHAWIHWKAPSEGTAQSASVTPSPAITSAADVEAIVNQKFNTKQDLTLWNIQPGLGTVMIEYGMRMGNMWFAAQAGNWTMAEYQLDEMKEIQEVGETTRPKRAPSLKYFEDTYLGPLDKAIGQKEWSAFETAYMSAINGCNACHAGSTSGEFPGGYKFIKIKVPSQPALTNIDWAGQ